MASQDFLPRLTYEMVEGRIMKWLREEGSAVSAGQTFFVVETEKAAIEVPAEEAKMLLRVLVPADAMVPTGTSVAGIGAPGETVPEAESSRRPGELEALSPPHGIAIP